MAIIAHLTRHPKNCHHFVFKYASLLPMLQEATASPDKEARRYAFCALQNLSMDMSCRAPIAHSPKIIWSLTQRCKAKSTGAGDNDGNEDEARMAAVAHYCHGFTARECSMLSGLFETTAWHTSFFSKSLRCLCVCKLRGDAKEGGRVTQ